jgi:tRNA modification GTPase
MHRSIAGSALDEASGLSAGAAPAPVERDETIAAISTPPGEGAIALIRLSGPGAVAIADRVFRGPESPSSFPSNSQRLGEVVDGTEVVDQVMLSVHRAPASYTGEDVVEISCHGGVLVTARVLKTCLRAGARAARAGEFTERAFLNDKIDLTQAEAVMDLIRAQSDLALRSATEQLEGRLGDKISALREDLVAIIAHIDASIDFPDEDIAPDTHEKLLARLDAIREQLNALLATEKRGRLLREGVRVVIFGATNAGKSSLLNRLLGYDRAIVSEIPGTTRDTIEEVVNLGGLALRIVDTAGVRPVTDDTIEKAGIARTERSLELADIVLHVVDGNAPQPPHFASRPRIDDELLVLNKADVPEHSDWNGTDALRISCVAEDGLRGLDDAIIGRIGAGYLRAESGVAINARHHDCLRRALESCDRARAAIVEHLAPEYLAVDLHAALTAVGEVIGAIGTEDILDKVFGEFCIGK